MTWKQIGNVLNIAQRNQIDRLQSLIFIYRLPNFSSYIINSLACKFSFLGVIYRRDQTSLEKLPALNLI